MSDKPTDFPQPLGGNEMPRFAGPGTMMRLPAVDSAAGMDAAVGMHQHAFRVADPFGQCAYQAGFRARHLVDRAAAVVGVRNVEATCRV